jgi:hypothetical protein
MSLFENIWVDFSGDGLFGQIQEDGGEQKGLRPIGVDDGFSSKAPDASCLRC